MSTVPCLAQGPTPLPPEPGALRLVHPDPLGPVLDAIATPTPAVMRDARRWLDHLSAMAHEAAVVALSPVTAPATRAREVATGRRELGLLLDLWAAVDALPDDSLAGLTVGTAPRRYLARLVAAANAAAHALDLAAQTPLRVPADCKAMKQDTANDTQTPGVVLRFNDTLIRDRNEHLCLTDMWKASGTDKAKQPANWLASAQAKELVDFLGDNLNPRISGIALVETKRGGNDAGTWAHWHLAMAYAKYLSPKFHVWCNEVVRAYMEGRAVPATPADPIAGYFATLVAGMNTLTQAMATMAANQNRYQEQVAANQAQMAGEVAAIKKEVSSLHREHSDARDMSAIGETAARTQIMNVVLRAAHEKAKYLVGKKEVRSYAQTFYLDVRDACGGYRGAWKDLPRGLLGAAETRAREILREVRKDAKRAEAHGIKSEQIPLDLKPPRRRKKAA